MNKKILFLFAALMAAVNAVRAEDVLNVTPFTTEAGVVEDDFETFSIEMTNTREFTAMEFHLYLPEGLTLIEDTQLAMELSADRFPGTINKRTGLFIPNHNYSVDLMEEGHYYVTIYNADLETISQNEGELLIFYYETAADLQPGIYPITISGAVLGVDSHTGVYPPKSTSYVKVGNPENVTFAPEGYIPSFVNAALAQETAITKLDCSKVTGMGGTLSLMDNRSFVPPTESVTAPAVTYSRDMANEWGTVCLPFPLTSDENVQFYVLKEETASQMIFDEIDKVEAGQPAVFKRSGAQQVTFSAENVDLATEISNVNSLFTLIGVYEETKIEVDDANPAYYVKDDKFCKGEGFFTVPPFRAFFLSDGPNFVTAYKIGIVGDEPTSVKAVEAEKTDAKNLYRVNGQKVNECSTPGIYIINGEKIFVK